MPAGLELVKKFITGWNARDLDALLALAHPEFEYVNPPNAVEPGTRHGHEGLATVVSAQWEILGETAQFALEHSYRDGDDLIAEQRLTRSMPGSESQIEVVALIRWSFRDGLVLRADVLGGGSTLAEARALREPG